MKRFFLLTIILTVVVTGKVGAQEAASASKRANQQYVLFESERDKGTNVTAMTESVVSLSAERGSVLFGTETTVQSIGFCCCLYRYAAAETIP